MKARILALTATAIGALAITAGQAAAKSPVRYDVALGDSLSVGYQPNPQGKGLETNQGYTNRLLTIERKRIHGLRLVEFGCPGDTTGSLLTGHGNDAAAAQFHCNRTGGSQLKAAEAFLRHHHKKGEVALVTIDIGANDVDGCAAPGVNVATCVATGTNAIKTNTPLILKGLRQAARPGTPLAGMTLYDPVLSGYFSTDPTQKALAQASVPLLQSINNAITAADTAAGFKTADVAGAFDSYDTADTAPYNGALVPKNVAEVCTLTWACAAPPRGPNIHANAAGYGVIAGAFAQVLGKLK
jgi:lysophospholipase L1-like esterase